MVPKTTRTISRSTRRRRRRRHHHHHHCRIRIMTIVTVAIVFMVARPVFQDENRHLSFADAFASGFQKPTTFKNKKQKQQRRKQQKSPSYEMDDSDATRKLIDHLIDVEECEGLEALEVGFDMTTKLRGLYAKESFQKGDYICAVPFVSTIVLDETFYPSTDNADDNNDNDNDNDEVMTLAAARIENAVRFLDLIANNDEKGLSTLYRDFLPLSAQDENFSPTPDFWTMDEIKELQIRNLVKEMLDRKQQVNDRIQGTKNDQEPLRNVTEKEFLHALWLVRSRAFTSLKKVVTLDGTEGLLQRCVMIPYLDLLNHNRRESNADLEVVETKAYEESFYALVAKRPIAKGEELTICYGTGEEPSWELYLKYGFWPQDHQDNDLMLLPELSEPQWTTTLEQDLEEQERLLRSSSSGNGATMMINPREAIIDFRIRFKQLFLMKQSNTNN